MNLNRKKKHDLKGEKYVKKIIFIYIRNIFVFLLDEKILSGVKVNRAPLPIITDLPDKIFCLGLDNHSWPLPLLQSLHRLQCFGLAWPQQH